MKEADIQKIMKNLKCSRTEAIELLKSDESDEMTPEQAELEKKAKALPRRYETSTKPRKKAEKVRKVDTVKKGLLDLVLDALQDTVRITKVVNELAADFDYQGKSYTIKIIRHREPKAKN